MKQYIKPKGKPRYLPYWDPDKREFVLVEVKRGQGNLGMAIEDE